MYHQMYHQRLLFDRGVTEAEIAALRSVLSDRGWQSRAQLCKSLQWTERKVRDVANAAGREILRGPMGFNLTMNCSLDEILRCADCFRNQAVEMDTIQLGWRQIAHAKVG